MHCDRPHREDVLPTRLDELPFVSERGRLKLRPPSRERVVAARPLEDALRCDLPAPGDMLLLRPPALPPAPSGPRHRAHARPLTNTPTYPRKPRCAASAGGGCATAVTPAACATVAPPQCQPSAGQQQSLCGAREVEEAPCCLCAWCVVCVCPPPTHTRARHARARSSECGHCPSWPSRFDAAAETPIWRCAHVLTCSRVTCGITHVLVLGVSCGWLGLCAPHSGSRLTAAAPKASASARNAAWAQARAGART